MTLLTGAEAFAALQRVVLGERLNEEFEAPAYARLAKAVRGSSPSLSPASLDLLALVRHALRYASARNEGEALELDSSSVSFDKGTAFNDFGLYGWLPGARWRVRARPWVPRWLDGVPADGVDGAAAAQVLRRHFASVPADPFVIKLGHPLYQSVAQRAAMRALADSPEGSTLAVVLPTGEGKSLAFYLLATLGAPTSRGVTVVVTPTVSLALDHRRSAQSYELPGPAVAYEAGSEDSRTSINDGLANGSLSIVFASPEALVGPLRHGLQAAAKQGHLRALVIDEAHLVDAWGGTFRPHFQLLAGLRRALAREASPRAFRTVLLTATLTDVAAAVLRALFVDGGGPLPVIASTILRPEIEYWTPGVVDADTQTAYVSEAIRHLPRPLIVYATRPELAERLHQSLRESGFRRLLLMTGESDAASRQHVVDAWRQMNTDIVVATSAFGLGIDNQHVRSVVHACLPETLDRYYQEVGRTGRDGCASVSVLIPTYSDVETARSLGSQKPITARRGLQRWQSMFQSGERSGDGTLEVRVDDSPGKGPRDINMVNDANTMWNLRTLSLMAVSGLLEIDGAVERFRPDDDKPSGAPDERLQIRIHRPDHLSGAIWNEKVEPHRKRIQAAGRASLRALVAYLSGHACLAEVLAVQYQIAGETIGSPIGIEVVPTCAGCRGCRGRAQRVPAPVTRPPTYPWSPRDLGDTWLLALLAHGNRFVLRYSPPLLPVDRLDRERVIRCLARLMTGRFRNVRIDPAILTDSIGDLTDIQDAATAWPFFVGRDSLVADGLPPGPAIIIANSDARAVLLKHRPATEPAIVLLPSGTSLLERYDGLHLDFDEFCLDYLE